MSIKLAWFSSAVLAAACAPVFFLGCGDDAGTTPQGDASSDGGGLDSTTTTDTGADSTADRTMTDAPADQTAAEAQAEAQAEAGVCALVDAGPLDDAAVAAGQDLVANVYRCWRCHQSAPLDAGLTLGGRTASTVDGGLIFPSNLTPDLTGLGCWTDPQIVNAILNGYNNLDAGLCVMPKFGQITNDAGTEPMDAATAQQIVTFLHSLQPVSLAVPMTVCPSGVPDAGGGDASDGGATADASSDAAAASNDAGAGDAGDSGEAGD